jgi:hypothetical protein
MTKDEYIRQALSELESACLMPRLCPGYWEPFRAMVTCQVCQAMQTLNAALSLKETVR